MTPRQKTIVFQAMVFFLTLPILWWFVFPNDWEIATFISTVIVAEWYLSS